MTIEKTYDLAVAYRIYPRVSKIPAIFPEDKFQLARVCLRSLRESLGNLRVKMFVLLDGCPKHFDELFTECFESPDLELIHLAGVGNRQTFSRQIDILLQQQCAEAVYFAEDDYFYLPDQFQHMLRFLQAVPGADFVSPYDHPDYYVLPLHGAPQDTRQFDGQSWRTAASTCLTFLTTKKMLAQNRRLFRTYTYGNPDVSLWLSLTKQAVFDPEIVRKCLAQRAALGGFVAISWLYGWPQILSGPKRKIWVPNPSIATHTEKRFLAPGIDWQPLFENAINDLRPRPSSTVEEVSETSNSQSIEVL
jgi:hypothetical protein